MPPPRESGSKRLIPIIMVIAILVASVALGWMIMNGMRQNPREGAGPATKAALFASAGVPKMCDAMRSRGEVM